MNIDNYQVRKIFQEKGELSVSSITLYEFKMIIDAYLEAIAKEKKEQGTDKVIIETHVDPNEHKLVNSKELCEILNISMATFHKMKSQEAIPEYLVCNTLKYNVKEVKEYLRIKMPPEDSLNKKV